MLRAIALIAVIATSIAAAPVHCGPYPDMTPKHDPQLVKRANELFPWISQGPERTHWLNEQELQLEKQRADRATAEKIATIVANSQVTATQPSRARPAPSYSSPPASEQKLSSDLPDEKPNFFDAFDRPTERSGSQTTVPTWDDLHPVERYNNPYLAPWRFTALSWMRFAERCFLIAIVLSILVGLAFRFFFATKPTSAAEEQTLPWNKVQNALRLAAWQGLSVKRREAMITLAGFSGVAWWSIRDTLDPSSSDRAQLLVNLDSHPIASFAGALLPGVVLFSLAYWMRGRAIPTKMARRLREHLGGQSMFKEPEPRLLIALGIVVAVGALLMLDRWVPMWGLWSNIMLGKTWGIPYRYILLCSCVSVAWGGYRHLTSEKSYPAADRSTIM